MRKIIRSTFLFMVSFLVLFAFGKTMLVHADYDINKYRVVINIDKSGDADVQQSVHYSFDDDYHGVYTTQSLSGIKGAKFQDVVIKTNGKTEKVAEATSGAENTYKLTQNKKQMKVKVYHKASYGNDIDVIYRYKLFGVVTNYLDTAELNWKIIGDNWDVPLKNVRIKINLPASNISKLRAWTHSNSAGYTNVARRTGRVIISMSENEPNNFVGAHLLFPTSVTPQNRNVVKKKRLKQARKLEANLVRATNEKQQHQKLFYLIATLLAIVVGVLTVGINVHWILTHRFKKYQKPIPINHSFEIPPVSPAIAEAIWSKKRANTNALSAEMLVMANRKELQLEPVDGKQSKKKTVKITVLKKGAMAFLDNCVTVIGNGKSVTLDQIKHYAKIDMDNDILSWFSDWQDDINDKVEPYEDRSNIEFRSRLLRAVLVTAGFTLGISALATQIAIDVVLMTLSVGLSGTLVLGIYLIRIWKIDSIYNQEGLELENQVNGFRQMLDDIGHFNTAQIGDLLLWEEILPYAAAFGLADKVADKLKVDFGSQLNESVPFYGYYYLGYGIGLNESISGSLGQAMAGATTASVSGGSGGFVGGSSGGFGGGSGGGAF